MKSKTGFGSMKAVEDMSEEPQNTKQIQIHVTCRQYYTTCFTKCANGRQKQNQTPRLVLVLPMLRDKPICVGRIL
jgi:hypothetical protein